MRKYLKQTTTGEVYVWTRELASRPDMVPFIGTPSVDQDETRAKIAPIQSDVIRFHLSARGLGDSVTGLYAACGIASAGYQVEFHTNHGAWLKAEHKNLKIVDGEFGVDANANYRQQLLECRLSGISRSGWYIKNLTRAYGLRPCAPVRPDVLHHGSSPLEGSYALLAPFSNAPWRMWGLEHWRRLAMSLIRAGKKVVVMGDSKNGEMAQNIFYGIDIEPVFNGSAEDVIGLISGADFLVCNDSGPAHLGGLYGKRTIVVTAQFTQEYLFDCGYNIEVVRPVASCVSCFEQDDAGWDQLCNVRCSALQTVRPDDVFIHAMGV